MCFQFDVYRNPSDKTREYQPYFMIIQHELLSANHNFRTLNNLDEYQ